MKVNSFITCAIVLYAFFAVTEGIAKVDVLTQDFYQKFMDEVDICKADIKKYATSYIIGALVLFGASGLVSLAKSFVDSSLGEGGESA